MQELSTHEYANVQVTQQLAVWRESHDGSILDAVAADIASATEQLHASAAAAGGATAAEQPPPPADVPPAPHAAAGSAGQAPGGDGQLVLHPSAAVAAALAKLDTINAQLRQVSLSHSELPPAGPLRGSSDGVMQTRPASLMRGAACVQAGAVPRVLTASSIEAALAAKFAAANARFAAMHPEAAGVPAAQPQPPLLPLAHHQQPQQLQLLHALPPQHPGVAPAAAHADAAAAAKLSALNAKLAQYQQPALLGPGKHGIGSALCLSAMRARYVLTNCDERACAAASRYGSPTAAACRTGAAARAVCPTAAVRYDRLAAQHSAAAAAAAAGVDCHQGGRPGQHGGSQDGCSEQGRAVMVQPGAAHPCVRTAKECYNHPAHAVTHTGS